MNASARRTTGQPSYNGSTETQFRFWLAGALLCLAATIFAIFVASPIGLTIIAVTSYFLGYLGSTEKVLNRTSRRADIVERMIVFTALRQAAIFVLVAIVSTANFSAYDQLALHASVIFVAGLNLFLLGLMIGQFTRASWNGFRI